MRTNIISIVSAKGGVGKTTVALNLAVALAERGRSTLLVDLDPQGAVAFSLARNDTEWIGLAEVMLGKATMEQALIRTKVTTLSILPRGRLHPADVVEYEKTLHTPDTLDSVLNAVRDQYNYVVLDTPSGLGMITRAALAVSGYALVPLQAEPLAMRTVSQVLKVIDQVQQNENPDLNLLGLLPTMVELRQDPSFNVMHTLWSGFGGVTETFIPRAEIFSRASEVGLPVAFLSGKTPPDALRFDMLVSEIENIMAEIDKTTGEDDEKGRRELV